MAKTEAALAEESVAVTLPFPNGSLITIAGGNGQVFFILFGQTCYIPSPQTAQNLFGSGWPSLVQQCTQAQYNAYPAGPPLSMNACIIQAPTGQLSLYSWGQYFWIVNPTVQAQYNFQNAPLQQITQAVFSAMPQNLDITGGPTGAFADGSLIEVTPGGTQIYLVIQGQTCWIQNPTTAQNLFGSNWQSLVQQCTQAQFNAYPAGPPITANACLITTPASQLALFSWNQWCWIVSAAVSQQYNFNGTPVPVNATLLGAMQQGLDITG